MPVKFDFKHSYLENECGNLDCSEYYVYGDYMTKTTMIGKSEMYITGKFSRPTDQPLTNSTKLRYGFWVDSGPDGVEGFTCGWSYKPLLDRTFGCISYKQPYSIE